VAVALRAVLSRLTVAASVWMVDPYGLRPSGFAFKNSRICGFNEGPSGKVFYIKNTATP
jgi:hypothetical protein